MIVQYKNHVGNLSAAQLSRNGGSVAHEFHYSPQGSGPAHLVKLRSGQDLESAIKAFAANPDVEFAQPNYIYHAKVAPNDTSYGQLWGLKNTGQTVTGFSYGTGAGTLGKDIDAETAWNTVSNCASVVVAVIDSGVNYNQQDLTANMVNGSYTCPVGTGTRGCDFVGTGDADPMDTNGHGTHVAGIIGGVGNNATGISGVCQTASILAVRVLDTNGSGTTVDIVEGLNFAIGTTAGKGNAKIVNLSLGGPSNDAAFSAALTTANNNGVTVVVAAGNATQNHNVTHDYPCDYTHSNIICVAAADQNYGIASFSDFDNNATVANRTVDIAAPGTNILSTYYGNDTVIADTFNTAGTLNWTTNVVNSWYYSNGCLNPAADLLYSPASFCNGTTPANGLNYIVYKNFNLSAYTDASISFNAWVQLKNSGDTWTLNSASAGGDPFAGGTTLLSATGPIDTGGLVAVEDTLSGCLTAACTVGFRVITDATANNLWDGAGIAYFSITGKTPATNVYSVLNGTSMASPYVAGIAALVKARNPSYTNTDIVNAILAGGDVEAAFASKTKTGMVADAFGALKYIPAPDGVTLTSP